MPNVYIREAIYIESSVGTHVSRDDRVQVNPNASITASSIRDFTRMNPPTFFASKVENDQKGLYIKYSRY